MTQKSIDKGNKKTNTDIEHLNYINNNLDSISSYRILYLQNKILASRKICPHFRKSKKKNKNAEIKLYTLTIGNKIRTCKNTKKASGGDGIPVELFQILKDDALKVLHSTCQQI